MNEFENEPALQPAPEAPIPIVLTLNQETMFNAMPVGHENAKLARDIIHGSGLTIKSGRRLIKFLHTHGIINWVPKVSTARYKKWFNPPTVQI